jgi:DNA excision repair protein ERCC-2
MVEFPYPSFRPGQREVAEQVEKAVREGSILLLNAPTGFGKTAAIIYGLLRAGVERVIYVVRTRNEIQPVVRELERFGARYTFLFSARRMCPLLRHLGEDDVPSVEEFWESCRLVRLKGACNYYANLDSVSSESVRKTVSEASGDPFVAVALLSSYKLCPFFALKMLIDDSVFIVATYPYLFNTDIFTSIFEPRSYEDFVLVIDEAHSLMDAHTMMERRLTLDDIDKAINEVAERMGKDSELVKRLEKLRAVVRTAHRSVRRIESEKLAKILGDPEEWSDVAHEIRVEKLARALDEGGSVRVYTSRVAALAEALAHGARTYLALDHGRPALKAVPVDPCYVVEEPLNRSASAILMSGTMPPANYVRDVLCIRKPIRVYDVELFHPTIAAEYARSRRVVVIANVTSKYVERGERIYQAYASYVTLTAKLLTRGVMLVVFPSYEFMSNVVKLVDDSIRERMVVEEQATTITEVREVARAKAGEGLVVAAVAGGKLVEGVELVDDTGASLIALVFVAGVPYPQPDPVFEDYMNVLSAKLGEESARDYAYNVTAAIKVRQAIGRAQRRPGDRVLAVLADRRFLYRRIRELLRLRYDRVVFSVEAYERAARLYLEELGVRTSGV